MPNNHRAEPTTEGKATEFSNTKNTAKAALGKRAPAKRSRALQGANSRPLPPLAEDDTIRLRVQHYLDGFCHAMLEGDTKTLAAMWSVPSFVIDTNNSRVIDDAAEVERFFSGAKAMYHERGIVDTHAQIEAIDVIAENLVMVLVRWPYIDASGREIGSESSTYTLKSNDDGEFKMSVCTMRGETHTDDGHH